MISPSLDTKNVTSYCHDMESRSSEPAETQAYSILELVQASGVPRRTIRYYVQRGLLLPPEGAGRGHYYRLDQLEQLLRIRELQAQGRSLDEIRVLLDGRTGAAVELPPPPYVELVTRIHVGDGLELIVGPGVEPPTLSQLHALATAAVQILERRSTP